MISQSDRGFDHESGSIMNTKIYGEDTKSECDRGTSAVDGPSSSEFGLTAVHMEASANEGCRQLWKLCCLYHAW